jgi:hypothetical protein
MRYASGAGGASGRCVWARTEFAHALDERFQRAAKRAHAREECHDDLVDLVAQVAPGALCEGAAAEQRGGERAEGDVAEDSRCHEAMGAQTARYGHERRQKPLQARRRPLFRDGGIHDAFTRACAHGADDAPRHDRHHDRRGENSAGGRYTGTTKSQHAAGQDAARLEQVASESVASHAGTEHFAAHDRLDTRLGFGNGGRRARGGDEEQRDHLQAQHFTRPRRRAVLGRPRPASVQLPNTEQEQRSAVIGISCQAPV